MNLQIIEEMKRCLHFRPPHVRITKWRLNYSEANKLAHELYELQGVRRTATPPDILGAMVDGNQYMLGIPVEVKPLRFETGRVRMDLRKFIVTTGDQWKPWWCV